MRSPFPRALPRSAFILFTLAPVVGGLAVASPASAQRSQVTGQARQSGPADIPTDGVGYGELMFEIDALVRDVMEDRNLPGMSVAVTRHGRLVHARSYGWADVEAEEPMRYDSRVRIGSVGKAVVTGPTAIQLLRSEGIDPATTRLYGTGGVFGTAYAMDAARGIRRHTPIVALAISPRDRVFAWYTNGTVSSGTSRDLDARTAPRPYSLPPGMKPVDIRAIAIAKDSRVYVWYDDGTRSVGTSTDLDRHVPKGTCKDDDRSGCVALPGGKDILHVVGIGIAKSNDHVYVWYDDGAVSSGTSMDFDRYFGPRSYSTTTGSSYDVRGVGIAADDHVYAWFANGAASSGTSTDLGRYRASYAYSYPPSVEQGGPDWPAWYSAITLQHLLDHEAGFSRSGDIEGAAAMFGVPEDDLTYEQAHRHFLATRKLLFEPGTDYSYSNHGFGLWTLLVAKISGLPFRTYARDRYLAPRGLEDDVVPESATRRQRDALPHGYADGGGWTTLELKESTLGLAAGGYLAAAMDLARLMVSLEARYTPDELDDMGWRAVGPANKRKFEHGGVRGGGMAYVVMFPDGYTAHNGADLSRIHVALGTNIRTEEETAPLERLSNAIALATAAANVPATFSIRIEGSSWPVTDPEPQVDGMPELTSD